MASALGPRLLHSHIDWSGRGLALDSLARMQLATAGATWCNAYDSGFEDLFLAKRSSADWAVLMQRCHSATGVGTAGENSFTFSTSGTSGVRKHIRHRQDTLASEAHMWANVLNAGQPTAGQIKRVVTLVPTHHIYGFLWGVLLPLALDVGVVDAHLQNLPPLLPGDLIVGVPDQWQWLASTPSSRAHWPQHVTGISSTAALPAAVHQRLVAANADTQVSAHAEASLARLLQIYGSSETAGLGWRTDPEQPYTLAPGRSKTPDGGIELLLPGGSLAAIAVQDELQWVGAESFYLLKRHDQSVQVGGHNVSPAWVTQQLMSHPSVSHATTRLSTKAQPPRLKAFVVLAQPGSAAQRVALEQWVLEHLPWYANFSTVTYGPELPQNAMGKPSDWPE